ncbi:CLUMA_CG016819, isoform A [Clunio marinus]|uniref:CLUMA_CG016819, isoform A n=1 Tax=Clunio marinus TaxID=568069 RepID=A0A1J1IWG2_9DIPT|nr:CLUMA_CG016819, isoform A [Clunio marinus]
MQNINKILKILIIICVIYFHPVISTLAERNQFPSQVIVKWKKKFACTGNIINECWVLTVASCFDVYKPQNVSIVAGSNVINVGGIKRKVARVIIHEQYLKSVNKYDIALLELKKCLNLDDDDSIKKIKLMKKRYISPHEEVTIVGWLKQPGDKYLNYNTLFILGELACKNISPRYDYLHGIFCLQQHFFMPTGFRSPCLAGKGGAAICNGELCGIGSIIYETCYASTPLGYTNINDFKSWISEAMERNLE